VTALTCLNDVDGLRRIEQGSEPPTDPRCGFEHDWIVRADRQRSAERPDGAHRWARQRKVNEHVDEVVGNGAAWTRRVTEHIEVGVEPSPFPTVVTSEGRRLGLGPPLIVARAQVSSSPHVPLDVRCGSCRGAPCHRTESVGHDPPSRRAHVREGSEPTIPLQAE